MGRSVLPVIGCLALCFAVSLKCLVAGSVGRVIQRPLGQLPVSVTAEVAVPQSTEVLVRRIKLVK